MHDYVLRRDHDFTELTYDDDIRRNYDYAEFDAWRRYTTELQLCWIWRMTTIYVGIKAILNLTHDQVYVKITISPNLTHEDVIRQHPKTSLFLHKNTKKITLDAW